MPIQTTKMTNFRWTVCTMLFVATTVSYLDRQVLSLTWKDFIAPEFGWGDDEYSRITAYFSLVYAFVMLFTGKLIDWAGIRRGYVWAMVIWSFGAILHGFCGIMVSGIITDHWFVSFDGAKEMLRSYGATGLAISSLSVWLFTFCRVILAVGSSANFPAAVSVTAEYFPKKDRAFATAVFNTGASVGALAAPLTIPLIARSFGWETAFIVVGAIGYLWVLVWMLVYDSPAESRRVNASELNYITQDDDGGLFDFGEQKQKTLGLLRCLSYRPTWAFVVGKFMTDGSWWFHLFWTPVYISENYAYTTDSPMGMALIFVLYLITISSVAGGYLPTYFVNRRSMTPSEGRMRAMLIFACFQLTGFFILPMSNISPWLFILLIGIQGACHQSWSANIFSMVGDVFPKGSIATVIGIGGCAGGLASYLVMRQSGMLFNYVDEIGSAFTFLGYEGRQGAYMMMFSILGTLYIIGWLIIKMMMSSAVRKRYSA